MKWLSPVPVRFAVFIATAHFLVYHAIMGAYLVTGQDSPAFPTLFSTLEILDRPANILAPLVERFGWVFRAICNAISYPIPLLAPVAIAIRPVRSGMSAAVHFVFMVRLLPPAVSPLRSGPLSPASLP